MLKECRKARLIGFKQNILDVTNNLAKFGEFSSCDFAKITTITDLIALDLREIRFNQIRIMYCRIRILFVLLTNT